MARHQFTPEECKRGGQKSALHPRRKEICAMGFEAVVQKRPECLLWLHKKIRRQNKARKEKEH